MLVVACVWQYLNLFGNLRDAKKIELDAILRLAIRDLVVRYVYNYCLVTHTLLFRDVVLIQTLILIYVIDLNFKNCDFNSSGSNLVLPCLRAGSSQPEPPGCMRPPYQAWLTDANTPSTSNALNIIGKLLRQNYVSLCSRKYND